MSDKAVKPADSVDADKDVKPPKPVKPPKEKAPAKEKPAKDAAKKKGGFPIVLVLVPVALVAALVLAFMLPPTHAIIMKSPLGPLLARFDKTPAKAIAAAGKATDPAADVKHLNDALENDRKVAAQKDAQIAQLQSQVNGATPAASASPAIKATPAPAVITDEMKRAATYWAGMDPDKAAEIIKQLPDAYVKTVFTAMPADAVADIMSELPAKTAARLTTSLGDRAP